MHRPGDELKIVDPAKLPDIGAWRSRKGWYWRGDVVPDLAASRPA
jgi:hypothetical protein